MKTNKNINSMFALLLAAAVLLGGSIWFACSAEIGNNADNNKNI